MSKISVIVPAYNVGKYISECLDSLLSQTFKDMEIIVVDDGSTDNTPYICDQYGAKYANVSVIHKKNGGTSDARNTGLKFAQGDYVGFVDADDVVSEDMYSELFETATKTDADIVICNYCKVDSLGSFISDSIFVDDTVVCGDEALTWINRKNGWRYVLVMPKLYKKEVFDEVSFPEGKIHEDEYVAHLLFHRSKVVAGVSKILYSYRSAENSIMTGKVTIKRLDAVDAIFHRFRDYERWGFAHLLRGTLECSKNSLSLLPRICVNNNAERTYIKDTVTKFRYMVKQLGLSAGLINWLIAVNPQMYYRVRNRIKRI